MKKLLAQALMMGAMLADAERKDDSILVSSPSTSKPRKLKYKKKLENRARVIQARKRKTWKKF